MISLLTDTLEQVPGVEVAVSELRLPALSRYRSAAFRLMRALSAEDVAEEFSDDRTLVGRHVSGTLRLPEDWGDEWRFSASGGEPTEQFVRRLQREGGDLVGRLASTFLEAADELRHSTAGLNPMRARLRELLDELGARPFLVLLQRPIERCRQHYAGLDRRFTEATLCRESDLRRPGGVVDVLITTGRFDRFTPDHILTAPRWRTIANVRWAGDADDREDFPLFPCLRLEGPAQKAEERESVLRSPVEITRSVRLLDHGPAVAGDATAAPRPPEETEWDAITFDEWYLGKRQRLLRGEGARPAERPASYSGFAVYVGTTDGGGLFVPVSEDGRARALLAFDPFEMTVAMRRPSLDPDAPGDRGEHLEEGMMLVLPEEAVEVIERAPARRVRDAGQRDALKSEWKQRLVRLIECHGPAWVARQLEALGVSLTALPSTVQRWARGDGINAPRSEEHFRVLVRDVLGLKHPDSTQEQQCPWWVSAWDAVLYERSLSISLGLLEENARAKAVKNVILEHVNLVTDAARRSSGVTLSLGGGEGKVRVVTVEFIETGQGKQRFCVPEAECLRYVEPHESRLRWMEVAPWRA